MIVAIDAGNTRIKWGVSDGSRWIAQGALPTAKSAHIAEVSKQWPADAQIVGCNVAGEAVEATIDAWLAPGLAPIRWLHSSPGVCGVRNSYDQPDSLGADRWSALIGARKMTQHNCVVVCAGTATTVDWLDAEGVFRGGMILPGFELMRTSLAQNTVLLPLADGQVSAEPHNTRDAIVSGCLNAQVGAIERMFSRMASDPEARCLITGGAAKCLVPHLSIPYTLVENLIFEGLVAFAASQ
jgi:type III pantothenate kinase